MSKITLTITMTVEPDYTDLHMSRPGRARLGFDTGEDYSEMELAIDDLAAELKNIYKLEQKRSKA